MSESVETPIDRLAALQEIDCRLREKTELVQSLEREMTDLENELALQRERTRVAQAERDAVEARRRELEAHLEDEEAKMTDRRMRLNRVRNEKELNSIRREIEIGKEANQQTEEQLLGIFESLEALNAAAKEAETLLHELEQAGTSKVAERLAHISQLKAEVESQREGRAHLAAALDRNLRQKYEQIFERRGGTAVVEVRNGTCLGCHMNLPPQFFNELQRTREVRLCPSCHRILFWRPERLDQAETPR
ncbi:MAG: zinc ribbon domain-containing protein [Candidatus Binatia bacterium]